MVFLSGLPAVVGGWFRVWARLKSGAFWRLWVGATGSLVCHLKSRSQGLWSYGDLVIGQELSMEQSYECRESHEYAGKGVFV